MYASILDWLDEAAITFKDKIIYKDENTSLSFDKLNGYTLSIGTFLAGKIKANAPVVVMSGRSVFTPACFLGVVRAGGFYAPIDAGMPLSRLNQIIDVIQSDYMVVDREHLSIAHQLEFKGDIFVLEDIMDTPADMETLAKARCALTCFSPLYVIFTSGSTGKPKGVITSHLSLKCYIDSVCKVLGISDKDVLGNQSPLDYIAAIRDIYIPIRTGAQTVIIPKNEFSMPTRLFETLNNNKVTTLCWSVTGIELPAKLGAFDCVKPEYVNKVCFSGSVISGKLLKVWKDNLPNALFVNQYGPTEATASCTYQVVEGDVDENTVLPIGKPYDNYSILLLNEDLSPTPNGEIGEICVGGPCLALGYYGNKELSDGAFIQNPLNKQYRELIYKTGDLGRYNEDGILEFHGRKDRQIKHMGHRIELGEIEGTAKKLGGIVDCVALYQKEKELLYLFYTGDATPKDITLYFRSVLPAFMLPRKLVQLEQLPLLPNGKTDMQALKNYFK